MTTELADTDVHEDAIQSITELIGHVAKSRDNTIGQREALGFSHRAVLSQRERMLARIADRHLPDMSLDTLQALRNGEFKTFVSASVEQRLGEAIELRKEWSSFIDWLFGTYEYRRWLEYCEATLPRLQDELLVYLDANVPSSPGLTRVRELDLEIEALQQREEVADRNIAEAENLVATLRSLAAHCAASDSYDELAVIVANIRIAHGGFRAADESAGVYDDPAELIRNWIAQLPRSTREWGAIS